MVIMYEAAEQTSAGSLEQEILILDQLSPSPG